jgi:hypothetical protein
MLLPVGGGPRTGLDLPVRFVERGLHSSGALYWRSHLSNTRQSRALGHDGENLRQTSSCHDVARRVSVAIPILSVLPSPASPCCLPLRVASRILSIPPLPPWLQTPGFRV